MKGNPRLKEEYTKFIHEYAELNHMERVEKEFPLNKGTFYLPHHAVIKESSTTTKLRVVFDGSAKSTSQISVKILMIGPNIQQDLFSFTSLYFVSRHYQNV